MTTTQGRARKLNGTGVVVIGRNEGERLRRCLESLAGKAAPIVYVDSGSVDGSVELSRGLGADVVALDLSTPFTAARARNAGLARLRELAPDCAFVHFFDGDCEAIDGWLEQAVQVMLDNPRYAAVWGRLRERFPGASLYNRLCDLEWKWNIKYGEVHVCGGIALMRIAAVEEAGGFNPALIAGEEPELCYRMRRNGWKVYRLRADMALHDAAMMRFGQWWRRSVRSGYADAERAAMHRGQPDAHWVGITRGTWFWGALLPAVALLALWPSRGLSALLTGGYLVKGYRTFRYVRGLGAGRSEAGLFAIFSVLAKFPSALGQFKYTWLRLMGRRGGLIEYK